MTSGEQGEPTGTGTGPAADLHSRLNGPIADLNRLQRSLLFAELSMVSYLEADEAIPAARVVGFDEGTFVERDGAQAYVFDNDHDRVIVCRGTEPNEWNDIKADANAFTDLAETVGRVHRGFKREVDDLWPKLREFLENDTTHTVWFAGHSLGGAMASICAGRCQLEDIPAAPEETYTFGSPRVGTKRYVTHASIEHVRWVNNNDIVTRVPPAWLRYRHTGTRMYIDSDGRFRRISARQLAKDRWRGFKRGLRNRKLDHFADHAIAGYVGHIARAAGVEPGGKS